MRGLRERADADRGIAELLEAVLTESGYLEALEAERTIEAEGRVENLEELISVAREFDANRELEGPPRSGPSRSSWPRSPCTPTRTRLRDAESLVTLMTLHNAKGLEYDAVFIIGCEEGLFPHTRSVEEGNLEEERRLCYVGVTRASERLYLTFARQRRIFGGRGYALPSRFIGEIPEELVERQATAPTTGGWARRIGAGEWPEAPPRKAPRMPVRRPRGRRRRRPRHLRGGCRDGRRAWAPCSWSVSPPRPPSAS